MVATFLLWAATAHHGKYRLPSDAKITIGKAQTDGGSSRQEKDACSAFTLTEQKVRQMFRSYTLYVPARDYESYDDSPCHIQGTISYRGKTYTYDSENGEKMRSTTWPDGKEKALAGEPTDWSQF